MYFGGTPFAASPFGDPGFNPNAFVNVTGSRINESTGTVSLVGKANFAVTGSRVNFSIGNTSVIEGVGVIVTPDGSRVNITTGDPTIVGKAVTAITGSRVNLNTGTPTFAFGYPVSGSKYWNRNNISRCKFLCNW
jgi:hypothetical protein